VTTFIEAPAAGEARPPQPRALIVTIYGLYARDRAGQAGGWLSVAALIRLMAGLGADQATVRSSISRLKQRGGQPWEPAHRAGKNRGGRVLCRRPSGGTVADYRGGLSRVLG
jgi:phenylacetic acid degradation operon negative regulatory protein